MNKYKNISDRALTIPGIGIVEPGAIVELPHDHVFRNANFEKVEGVKKKTTEKAEGEDEERKVGE